MSTPYAQYLDSEALGALEAKLETFDRQSELRFLHKIGMLPFGAPAEGASDESFFQREARHFARDTRDDAVLRSYISKESDIRKRAMAICGRLTEMPNYAYCYLTLGALLAYLGPAIWADDSLVDAS